MKNNHKSAKLDALLFKAVKIVFWDGSTEKGLLYDHDSAIKYTGRIICNTPYFLLLYDGTMIGFYKTHVKKIIYNEGDYCEALKKFVISLKKMKGGAE